MLLLEQEEQTDESFSLWKVKDEWDKKGHHSLGFSHGIAGIGYYLLALAERTGKEAYYSAVKRIVDTLDRTSYGGRDWREPVACISGKTGYTLGTLV